MSLLTAPLLPFAFLRRLCARPLPTEDLRPVDTDATGADAVDTWDARARAARARTEAESYLFRRQAELQADLESRR